VLGRFAQAKYAELPVVDKSIQAVLGMLRRQEVPSAYQARIDIAQPRGG
jgi:hypothetical protein